MISHALLSAAIALAAPAEPPADVGAEIAARAAARGVAVAPLLAPVAAAREAGLPADLVAAKVLEGLAKGAAPERIAAVAGALGRRLGEARALLAEAAEARLALRGPRPVALADLAAALGEGVPADAVRALVRAARDARGGSADAVVAAARTLGELARRGVPPDAALPLAVALAAKPPVEAGAVASLYDEWRAEGGEDPQPFLDEAARRAALGEPLADLVDHFGETPDGVVSGPGRGHGSPQARGPGREPGASPRMDDGLPRGQRKAK